MENTELYDYASQAAQELPGAELTYPFGSEWDVWKVRGKVFLLLSNLQGENIVNLKVDPFDGQALRSTYPEITPGYHMNKKHWITVRAGGSVNHQLLKELVLESYVLVVEGLPKSQQPVDVASFGRPSSEPDEKDEAS